MKRYWYRLCPACDGQGRLFVEKKIEDESLFLLCDECFLAFNTPEEAVDVNNSQSGMDVQIVHASQKDIVNYGWSRYPLQEATQ